MLRSTKLFRDTLAVLLIAITAPASVAEHTSSFRPFAVFAPASVGEHTSRFRPSGRDDTLKEILRRAGVWVQRFADDAVYIVADERYRQEYRTKDGASWNVERRETLSEIVAVRTPEEEARAGHPWVQFRDVFEVDGTPLPDHRGRLERLFEESGSSAYAQASALVQESARFNIGPGIRTVNVPSFALFFLHPRNQDRCRFSLGQVGRVRQVGQAPYPPVVVEYRERARPTMILSPQHQDLPASGLFSIDPAVGRVLNTRLEVQIDRHWTMTMDVTYGQDAGIDAWVPQTMTEHYGGRDGESLDCTATYSNYRRFRTSGRMIVK